MEAENGPNTNPTPKNSKNQAKTSKRSHYDHKFSRISTQDLTSPYPYRPDPPMAQTPKKYICCYCSRAFTRSEHKQRHERSHTNEKPFGCHYCNSAFVRRDLLQRHCRTVHNVRLAGRSLKDGKEPRTFEVMPLDSSGKTGAAQTAVPNSTTANVAASNVAASPEMAMAKPDSHLMASAQVLLQMAPKRHPGAEPVSPNYGQRREYGSVSMSPTSGQTHIRDFRESHRDGSRDGQFDTPLHRDSVSSGRESSGSDAYLKPPMGPSPTSHAFKSFIDQELSPTQLACTLKSLRSLYHPDNLEYPVDDLFLAGCAVLSNEPLGMLSPKASSVPDIVTFWLSGPRADYRLSNAYTILSIGALNMTDQDFDNEALATTLINKAWNILTENLIPAYTKVHDQIQILRNLHLLAYTYLRFFHNDLMLSYLEDSADTILKNLALQNDAESHQIVDDNVELFWSVYTLVSKAKVNKSPPKFFSWFLSFRVKGADCPLIHLMRQYPKPSYFTPGNPIGEIIICTIMSEVNECALNEKRRIFSSKKDIRQALRNIAKCIEISSSAPAQKIDAFELFKTKLLIDDPNNLKDHIVPNIFRISEPSQWTLFFATIRGLDPFINLDSFVEENAEGSFQAIASSYLNYFSFKIKFSQTFFDQLAISTFPLIFNHKLLTIDRIPRAIDFKELHLVDRLNLSRFVLHWYVMFVKVLVTLADKVPYRALLFKTCSEYPVLDGMFYAMGYDTRKTGDQANSLVSVLDVITKICDAWIVAVHSPTYLHQFRQNLYRCSKELLVLAASDSSFSLNNVCVTGDAITLLTRRSKSIGAIETGSLALSSANSGQTPFHSLPEPKINGTTYPIPPLESLSAPPKTPNTNYVLSGDSTKTPTFLQPPAAALNGPGPVLKPAPFQSPPTGPQLYAPALPPASRAPMVLPPLHTSMREKNHGYVT